MDNRNERQREYFYGMMSSEEKDLLKYLPTVGELLDFALEHYADRPALSDGSTTYTYAQLCSRVAVRRGFLNAQGFRQGDRIAVYSPNTMDAMETYLAIVTGGCVSVMLPSGLEAAQLTGLCRKFQVSALFYDGELEEKASAAGIKSFKLGYEYFGSTEAPMAALTGDTVCSICLTGGTTGIPKGAVMTHRAMMRGAFNGCFGPGGVLYQRYIAILPLSHIFGLVRSFLSVIYTGGLVFECRDVKRAFGMIPVLKPTALVLVPGMAEIIARIAMVKGQAYCESLKIIVTGAAPVPPKLMRAIHSLGITIVAGYGLTEGANLTSGNKDVLAKPDSMGMIYPEQEYKLENGELCLKGDNLMLGYYGDEKATGEVLDDEGWLHTGDLARFDDDGCIYIVGRIKNLIILPNGENVSPEELEEIFYKNPYVKDCLVKEDEMNGRKVIAVEILPDLPRLDNLEEKEIVELFRGILRDINEKLPTYKRISKLSLRSEDFRRTSSLKIARN